MIPWTKSYPKYLNIYGICRTFHVDGMVDKMKRMHKTDMVLLFLRNSCEITQCFIFLIRHRTYFGRFFYDLQIRHGICRTFHVDGMVDRWSDFLTIVVPILILMLRQCSWRWNAIDDSLDQKLSNYLYLYGICYTFHDDGMVDRWTECIKETWFGNRSMVFFLISHRSN